MEKLNISNQSRIDKEISKNYKSALKNPEFVALV